MTLQNLDIVIIRIDHKKQLCHHGSIALELLVRIQCHSQTVPSGHSLCHGHRVRSAMIDCHFHFKVNLFIFEIDQSEVVENVAILHAQSESVTIKVKRLRFVENAQHHVNRFCHDYFFVLRVSKILPFSKSATSEAGIGFWHSDNGLNQKLDSGNISKILRETAPKQTSCSFT